MHQCPVPVLREGWEEEGRGSDIATSFASKRGRVVFGFAGGRSRPVTKTFRVSRRQVYPRDSAMANPGGGG